MQIWVNRQEADSGAVRLPGGVEVGTSVSWVQAAFVTTPGAILGTPQVFEPRFRLIIDATSN